MPKPLSYEALFAALTVLGATACSKAAPAAKAEPAAQAPAAVSAAPAPSPDLAVVPGAGATAAPPAPVAAEPAPGKAADKDTNGAKPTVQATEPKKPAPRSLNRPKANAACGAGTCSDEMKK